MSGRAEEILSDFVASNRRELEAELTRARAAQADAEATLAPIARYVQTLEGLLGLSSPAADGTGLTFTTAEAPLTLHEAMHKVLLTQPGRRMRPADLAREVDRRGLYKMRDGRAVEATQIHARVGNYSNLFRKHDGWIEGL